MFQNNGQELSVGDSFVYLGTMFHTIDISLEIISVVSTKLEKLCVLD